MADVATVMAAPDLRSVGAALQWARRELAGSATAALDAEVLIAHVVRRDRSWVLAHDDTALLPADALLFRDLIARRAQGEPVAYLRGQKEWYGLELEVTPDVLVPRPETELVLETAVRLAKEIDALTVADVGTGSGALALGLAYQLPNASIVATDVSAAALAVAQRNITTHKLSGRVALAMGSLLDAIDREPDLVLANLPYLSDDMMASLGPDVRHEPWGALHGGATGLELYRDLMLQAAAGGWRCPFVLEIDPRQADEIRRFPRYDVQIETDYAGHGRIALLRARRSE